MPDTPEKLEELAAEIIALNAKHHIVSMFTGYTTILPRVEQSKDAAYYLVTLDPVAMSAKITGFKADQSQHAHREYTEAEKALPLNSPVQIVLVSVSSISALKRVYPNYFLDTSAFLSDVISTLRVQA